MLPFISHISGSLYLRERMKLKTLSGNLTHFIFPEATLKETLIMFCFYYISLPSHQLLLTMINTTTNNKIAPLLMGVIYSNDTWMM